MKKLMLLLAVSMLAFGVSACSDKSNDSATTVEAKDLPAIDMVATHAIDLDVSVAQLTFVPNSVAPWLGRIILLDDAGRLYSTDIEGRDPKPVGAGKYIDIFGLARKAAPGVFLAITDNNKIEAFIESDDDGNFSPMIYSGDDVDAKAFCINTLAPQSKSVRVLTLGKGIAETSLTIGKNAIEQNTVSSQKSTAISANCFDKPFDTTAIPIKTETGQTFIVSRTISHILNIKPLIHEQDFLSEREKHRLNINNGLSVRGLEHVKYVAATPSNYGGGAYADGVLALVDKDENRIVFISLSYAERQLLKAVNPPDSATAETPQ